MGKGSSVQDPVRHSSTSMHESIHEGSTGKEISLGTSMAPCTHMTDTHIHTYKIQIHLKKKSFNITPQPHIYN